MESIPFELIVQVAEMDHELWYKLSLVHRDFGLWSIQPEVKSKMMKLFDFVEMRVDEVRIPTIGIERHHFYLWKGKKHGIHTTYSANGRITTTYRKGVKHGPHEWYINRELRQRVMYVNGWMHGIETFIMEDGTPRYYFWTNGTATLV